MARRLSSVIVRSDSSLFSPAYLLGSISTVIISTSALVRQVQDLQRELGHMEMRAQLEERASSTIREERDRLLKERDEERRRADAERERAEEIRRELDELRSRGFWRRLFGG